MATAARRGARGAAAAPARSSGYRGAAGMRKMQEEHERLDAAREASKQASGMPFRFFCPVGETRQIVIVDEAPDFFRYEHNLQNPRTNKWDIFTACIHEHANCPICKASERGYYYAMYLTVIDLTPYENRDGDEVPWSKKLLVVKPAQQKKFARLFEKQGKGESFRGMVLDMTRDGDKDAAIGNEIEFVEFMPEDELLTYETEYTDKEDKVHEVIGHEVFNYDELFPEPTEQQLRAIVGGRAEPGSRDDDDATLGRGRGRGGRGGGDGWPDREERAERRPARRASRDTQDADETDEAANEAPTSRRAARSAVRREAAPAQPTRPVARRTRAAEPEPEPEAEERPQRARMAMRRGAANSAPAEDTPPARGAVNMAERRRALRRG